MAEVNGNPGYTQLDKLNVTDDLLVQGASAVSTSSNTGGGEGVALPAVGSDLPFKSITSGGGCTITSNGTEIIITVP